MAIGSPNHVFGRVASNQSFYEEATQREVLRPELRSVVVPPMSTASAEISVAGTVEWLKLCRWRRYQDCSNLNSKASVRATHGRWHRRSRRVLFSGQPSAGSELGDAIDREVSQARQGRAKIVANRDF